MHAYLCVCVCVCASVLICTPVYASIVHVFANVCVYPCACVHPCVCRSALLDPATVHRRLVEGVAAWDDSLPEHSETNEELSAYCPHVTPTHLLQHRGEGGSALMHAIRAGKVGAVAVLVYCGALSTRRRSSVVAAKQPEQEYLLHQVARYVCT